MVSSQLQMSAAASNLRSICHLHVTDNLLTCQSLSIMDQQFVLTVKYGTKMLKITVSPTNTLKDLRDQLFAQTGRF